MSVQSGSNGGCNHRCFHLGPATSCPGGAGLCNGKMVKKMMSVMTVTVVTVVKAVIMNGRGNNGHVVMKTGWW